MMERSAMLRVWRVSCLVALLAAVPALAAGTAGAAGAGTHGAFEWIKASPADEAMDAAALMAMKNVLAEHHTTGLLVIRNDRIVCEWYQKGSGRDKRHYTASMAKAIVGGVSLAVAISDGLISLDDKASKYVPQWKDDALRSQITIRQLGSHTSGIEDAEADGLPHTKLTGWKGDFWKRLPPPHDAFTLARDAAPVLFKPGTQMAYSNPGMAMLSYCTTACLRNSPQKDMRTLLRDRVMRPIGAEDGQWSVGYGRTYTVEGLPLVACWGGGDYTARAVARVGRLMMRQGNWQGRQLISADAVRLVTHDAGTPGNCGAGWWNNNQRGIADLPQDAFWGSGAGHQVVFVVPSLNLIAVRNGETLDTQMDHQQALVVYVFRPLIKAITDSGDTKR